MITITKKEYCELKIAELELNCLKAAGVDNWDGCEYAYENFEDQENAIKKEFLGE